MIENCDLFNDRLCLFINKRINWNDDLFFPIYSKYFDLFGNKSEDCNISINDIANLVNDALLRKEEYGNTNLDRWGRFDHDKSIFARNGLDQSPVIDELVLDVIKQLNFPIRSIWPEGKKFAVCLTHDVDSIDGLSLLGLRKLYWYWNSIKAKSKGNQEEAKAWASTLKQWQSFQEANYDPMDCFDQIQELEDSYGFRSTFYFMSLNHGLSIEGRRYSVKNPKVAERSKKLLEGGWEIGLHAAYHNHLSLYSLKKQKKRLEDVIQREIMGCRHHYLRVRFPESWEIYSQAGFKYSSNLGWGAGFQGFRGGTCLPYRPLREHSLLEIPFQLMDRNPLIDLDDYMAVFNRYLNSIKFVGGCLVVDFHQEHFRDEVAPGIGKVYRRILDAIANDPEAAVLTMNEVCDSIMQI